MRVSIRQEKKKKKKNAEKKKPMQISWVMRLVLETKSRLTWIDTEHKIILGWIRCAWLYIQLCSFLFVFSDFTDLKMLFHITYSVNVPGSSRPVLLTHRCFGGLNTTHTNSAAPRMRPEQSAATYSVIAFHSTQHMREFRTIPPRWCLTS